MRKLIVISGIPIDDLNVEETLDRLEEFVEIGRATGKNHQIATVNADFIVKAMSDPELRFLLQESDLLMPDGMPLVWGSRLLGLPMEERVAGSDIVPMLAERAAQKGYSLYLLGAAPGIAQQAADILQRKVPHPGDCRGKFAALQLRFGNECAGGARHSASQA
jgi:N-acetylglucosaminyldiphosphoundecaprenol N-acetyl-beta-D-mannosaminyltransferase